MEFNSDKGSAEEWEITQPFLKVEKEPTRTNDLGILDLNHCYMSNKSRQ
jgi:hypothetical protein